jgi:hypothetical protein
MPRPGKSHRTTGWRARTPTEPQAGGHTRPAIWRARTKGPRVPSPSFPQPPSGEGLTGKGASPRALGPAPSPPPARWAQIQPKFPVTFRRPGTGKTFSSTVRSRLPGGSRSFTVFPGLQSPESHPPTHTSLGTSTRGGGRQRPQAEPSGAAACRTRVGQNLNPALPPHVARQRDGGAG